MRSKRYLVENVSKMSRKKELRRNQENIVEITRKWRKSGISLKFSRIYAIFYYFKRFNASLISECRMPDLCKHGVLLTGLSHKRVL